MIGPIRLVALVLFVVGLAAPVRAGEPDTRETMREIFAAFVTLLGTVDTPAPFASAESRERTLAALRTLSARAEELEGGSLTSAHRSVRDTLAVDAAAATDAFVLGRLEGARFLVDQLAEDCFACHSKLPSAHRFALGSKLLEDPAVLRLPRDRRAMLAVAARQFERALSLYEAHFADRSISATRIALSGAFEGYLKVALRVLDERQRALRTLASFRSRGDLPLYLAEEVEAWQRALATLPAEEPGTSALVDARRAVREGQLQTDFPGDRRGLVQFVWASRRLHRWIGEAPEGTAALAEGFYLLGLCETHISPSLWLSEAEDFLESAIRAAPATPHARRAYATLEAVWIEGYTGSGGTHLPVAVERRLEALRREIEGQGPAAPPER